jgi:hypothetical protein
VVWLGQFQSWCDWANFNREVSPCAFRQSAPARRLAFSLISRIAGGWHAGTRWPWSQSGVRAANTSRAGRFVVATRCAVAATHSVFVATRFVARFVVAATRFVTVGHSLAADRFCAASRFIAVGRLAAVVRSIAVSGSRTRPVRSAPSNRSCSRGPKRVCCRGCCISIGRSSTGTACRPEKQSERFSTSWREETRLLAAQAAADATS